MLQATAEAKKKVREVIEDVKTCMFTTTDEECNVFSRPMFTIKVDNECSLWFFSNEYAEIAKNTTNGKGVTLVYSHPGKNSYMNVYGNCELVFDKEKMKELWQPALKAWFPEGIDDPSVCLMKVLIDEVQYWDNSSNDMICVYRSDSHKSYQTLAEEDLFIPQTSHW